MNKRYRIICLLLAIAFIGVLLISVIFSFASAQDALEGSRGETVYIETDAEGNVKSIVSSVYISNPDGEATITDYAALTGVKNISGTEAPVIDGDKLTFETGGEDVCYQGTAQGPLPFDVEIAYYLNSQRLTPEEIAGRSGRIRIEVKTKNNLKRAVEVEGESMELYTPFSVICMMSLGERFTSINARGAKVSAQAGQFTVLAVLLPGLRESLDMQEGDRVKDSFTLEADVKNFALSGLTFIGMTGIVDENDLSGVDDIGELVGALDEIGEASVKLYKGARSLKKGMEGYEEGLSQYFAGVTEVAGGTKEAADGTDKVYEGSKELAGGAGELADALDTIAGELDGAKEELDKATDPNAPVDQATVDLIEAAVNEAVRDNADVIRAGVRQSVLDALEDAPMTQQQKEAVADAVASGMELDDFEITIDEATAKAIRNSILSAREAQDLLAQLDELVAGLNQLADGAGQLAAGADQLSDAIKKLAKALRALADGLAALDENGLTLGEGAVTITKGLASLTKGLKALSEEGLSKIVAETSKVDASLSRKDALLELSEEYTSFSGTRPSAGGSIQFMLTTQSIEEPLPIYVPATDSQLAGADVEEQPMETGFFQRIADWFSALFESIGGWFRP